MYKDQLIVLIKTDGQPLRETQGKFVYLPFTSEYEIEIKNQSFRRAVASIKIDGTDVLGGQELIIPARDSVSVDRFVTDGNLSKGRRLKFVRLTDSNVQDPSSPENGLIEIEVWFEKIPQIVYTTSYSTNTWPMDNSSWPNYRHSRTGGGGAFSSATLGAMNVSYCCDSVNLSADLGRDQAGATVEGSVSKQSFVHGHFGEKDYPSTTFKIWLRGVKEEVTTKDKVYCTNCGKKVRFDYKYCPRCGMPVQIA